MKSALAVVTSLSFLTSIPSPAAADGGVETEPVRVGGIKIYGNTVTRDRVIHEVVNLFPGQVLDPHDLKTAEGRLRKLGIFRDDPENRPMVVVETPEKKEPFKNILVRVHEKNTLSLRWKAGLCANGLPVLRLVAEERNFDPTCWPRSVDDIVEGRVLRGAGLTVRLDLVEIDVLRQRVLFAAFLNSLLAPEGAMFALPSSRR